MNGILEIDSRHGDQHFEISIRDYLQTQQERVRTF